MTVDRSFLEPVLAARLGPVHPCVRALDQAFTSPPERTVVLRALRSVIENPGRLYPGSATEWTVIGGALASGSAAQAVAALETLDRKLFTLDLPRPSQRRRFQRLAGVLERAEASSVRRILDSLPAILDLADHAPLSVLETLAGGAAALDLLASYRVHSRLPAQVRRELLALGAIASLAARAELSGVARKLIDGLNRDTDPPPLRRPAVCRAMLARIEPVARDNPSALGPLLESLAAIAPIPLALDAVTVESLASSIASMPPASLPAYVNQLTRLIGEFEAEAVQFVVTELARKIEGLVSTSRALDGQVTSGWLDALVTCAAWSEEAHRIVSTSVVEWAARIPEAHHPLFARTLARLGPILPALGGDTVGRLAEAAHALAAVGKIEPFLTHAGELGSAHAETVEAFVTLASASAELGRDDHVEALTVAFHKDRVERSPWARKLPAELAALSEAIEPWGAELWSAALDPCLSAAATSPESALALARGLGDLLPSMASDARLPYLRAVHDLVHHYGVRFVGVALSELPGKVS